MMNKNDAFAAAEASSENLQQIIKEAEGNVEKSLKGLRGAAQNVKSVEVKHAKVKAKADAKSSSRNLAKLEISQQELNSVVEIFNKAENEIKNYLAVYEKNQEKLYTRQLEIGKKRVAKKIMITSDKYVKEMEAKIEKIKASIAEGISAASAENKSEPQGAENTGSHGYQFGGPQTAGFQNPVYDQSTMYQQFSDPYMPRPAVNVAPVNIDVSTMVESAVRDTIAKFKMMIDDRIGQYIANMSLPTANATPVSSEIQSATVVSYNSEDVEKLASLVEKLAALVAQLDTLSERTTALADAQIGANELLGASIKEVKEIAAKQELMLEQQSVRSVEAVVVPQVEVTVSSAETVEEQPIEAVAEKAEEAVAEAVTEEDAVEEAAVAEEAPVAEEAIAEEAPVEEAMAAEAVAEDTAGEATV